MRSLWTDQELKPGHAFIIIKKHKPEGIWKSTRYSVNYDCYGCWHSCGGGHPFTEKDRIDKILLDQKEKIRNCPDIHKRLKVKIKVSDFRKKQLTLTL